MAFPLLNGYHIDIKRRLLPSEYCMPSMQMATDHFNIGFTLSGDRKTITPLETYSYHAGDVSMAPPFFYHRTVNESDAPYESILIKFTPDYAAPFIKEVGQPMFDALYSCKVCRFNAQGQHKIKNMFLEMHEEYQKNTPYKEFILQGMLFRLFTTIWEERLVTDTVVLNQSPLTPPIIDALIYIETCYNQNVSLKKAAQKAHLSTGYFSRLFSAQLGMSFTDYLNKVRLRHVQIQLTQTDKSIMDIALDTGYCHGDYLSAKFKKSTGMTPSAFRHQFRQTKNFL